MREYALHLAVTQQSAFAGAPLARLRGRPKRSPLHRHGFAIGTTSEAGEAQQDGEATIFCRDSPSPSLSGCGGAWKFRLDVDRAQILFGGDHLGPQAWRGENAETAMAKARDLKTTNVQAGFSMIHLDCSEGCHGQSV